MLVGDPVHHLQVVGDSLVLLPTQSPTLSWFLWAPISGSSERPLPHFSSSLSGHWVGGLGVFVCVYVASRQQPQPGDILDFPLPLPHALHVAW